VARCIELQQYDFFQPQQPGGNAVAAFFLRHVFHNWADADSTAILSAADERLELKRVHAQGQSALLEVVLRK